MLEGDAVATAAHNFVTVAVAIPSSKPVQGCPLRETAETVTENGGAIIPEDVQCKTKKFHVATKNLSFKPECHYN